jgi:hypothetical protein
MKAGMIICAKCKQSFILGAVGVTFRNLDGDLIWVCWDCIDEKVDE